MPNEYRVKVYNASGQQVAEFADQGQDSFVELAYTKRLREPGVGQLVLRGLNPDLAKWVDKGLVEVERRNAAQSLGWYVDFRGIYLAKRLEYTRRDIATLTFPGDKWLLGTRVVAYYANVASRSVFSSAKPETIMKTLVNYNLGSSATVANGRLKEGGVARVLPGATLTTAADLGRGTNMDLGCQGDNLLTVLQKVASLNGVDFDLNYTAPLTWSFEYYPALGVDRSAYLTFSLERDNMADPVYVLDKTQEATAALVGGKGVDTARAVREVHGTNWSTSHDIEVWVNDTSADTNAALDATGAKKLKDLQALETFTQTPKQTDAYLYGLAYCVGGTLGDTVKTRFRSITATQRITGADISVTQDQGERVRVETKTL